LDAARPPRQPLGRFSGRLGIRVLSASPERPEAEMVVRDDLCAPEASRTAGC